jgi:uncharacterized phage infection (PIP) family protein YhgE
MAQNNKELEEAKRLLQEINTLRAKLNQTPLVYTDSEAVKNIQSLRNELKGVQNSFEDTADSATSLYDQIRAISAEFTNQPNALQKIRGSMKKITSIAEDLKMNEQGIRDLSTKNLDDLAEKLKLNRKILEDETRSILNKTDLSRAAQEDLKVIQEYVDVVKSGGKLSEDQLNTALETLQNSKDLTEEQLIEFIKKVKAEIPHIPVGYVDAYYEFSHRPNITELCDVILCNCYPFWEGCPFEYSLNHMKQMYHQAKAAGGGKQVIITETGWPSMGESLKGAVPSETSARDYFINTHLWAAEEEIPTFYFSSFDESWKVGAEGIVGAYWGIWDKNEKLKY